MTAFAVIYTLLGVGGSTIYAGCLGRYETKKADKVFTVTMLVAFAAALLILILGLSFIGTLSGFMCKATEYQSVFRNYIRVLILSGVLIIPILVVISFTPALGCPEKGTFLKDICPCHVKQTLFPAVRRSASKWCAISAVTSITLPIS